MLDRNDAALEQKFLRNKHEQNAFSEVVIQDLVGPLKLYTGLCAASMILLIAERLTRVLLTMSNLYRRYKLVATRYDLYYRLYVYSLKRLT